MYIYGKNPVIDLFEKDLDRILEVYLDEKKYHDFYKKLLNTSIKIFSYEEFDLKKINGQNTQKIIAKIKDLSFLTLNQIIEKNKDNEKSILIILDQIQDPQNFGSIIRSVSAFNGDGIIFSKNNSSPINATVIKSSSGAWVNVDLCQVNSLNSTIQILKKNNFWIFSTDLNATENIENFVNFNKPIAIIFGTEGFGVRKSLKEKADFLVKINISNNVESLNVSVAAAISLYLLKK